jgi:hypothetical protein
MEPISLSCSNKVPLQKKRKKQEKQVDLSHWKVLQHLKNKVMKDWLKLFKPTNNESFGFKFDQLINHFHNY